MSLEYLTKEELEDKFEMFLFHMDDNLEEFNEHLDKKGYELDFSLDSLDNLEQYLLNEKILIDDDDVNNSAIYFGEVVRKNYNGNWICNLDKEHNSLYYGLPVISGLSKVEGVLLSPFTSVKSFIIRPRKNHFKTIIEGYINPEEIDWTGNPDED